MMKKDVKIRKPKWMNYSWGDRIYLAVTYGILILITLICLYPLYFTVIASFSDAYEIYRGRVSLWPKGFTVEAYTQVMKNMEIWRGYANTIFYTVAGTLLNLFLTIPAAYGLSKKWLYGRGILMTVFIITMYFGGGMVPTYILMKNLGLVNTRTILVISGGLSVYNMIVTRTYFQNNIPETLYEAARIDGCSELFAFIRIALPLSAPILAVMTLYYAVGHWSSYFTALIYVSDREYYPLQLVLREILIKSQTVFEEAIEQGASDTVLAEAARKAHLATTMKYALVFISSAPMLILYPFIQKHFVKGIMIGSLKG